MFNGIEINQYLLISSLQRTPLLSSLTFQEQHRSHEWFSRLPLYSLQNVFVAFSPSAKINSSRN